MGVSLVADTGLGNFDFDFDFEVGFEDEATGLEYIISFVEEMGFLADTGFYIAFYFGVSVNDFVDEACFIATSGLEKDLSFDLDLLSTFGSWTTLLSFD